MVGFKRLNPDWSAEPNAPEPRIGVSGGVVAVTFLLNPFAYDAAEGEQARLSFVGCSHFRRDPTNDHAWFGGKGRHAGAAPEWGEFYEITGDEAALGALDWQKGPSQEQARRHFLIYFRDEVFECWAEDFAFSRIKPRAG